MRRNKPIDGSRYDTEDRTDYMARYYEDHRNALIRKAKQRYRDNREALSAIARERYTPKIQRHLIYR